MTRTRKEQKCLTIDRSLLQKLKKICEKRRSENPSLLNKINVSALITECVLKQIAEMERNEGVLTRPDLSDILRELVAKEVKKLKGEKK